MSRFEPITITLAEAREQLAREYGEAEADRDDAEQGSDEWVRLNQQLDRLDSYGRAVDWLINGDDTGFDGYGPDAEIRYRGLDAGTYATVENRTAGAASRLQNGDGVSGTMKVVYAAHGLLDAPFYTGSPEDLDAKIRALTGGENGDGQPLAVRNWLEWLIDQRTVVGEKNWRESAGPTKDAATPT